MMIDALPELRSKDFDVWEAAIRPRLQMAFAATYRISTEEARDLVAETIGWAHEFWDVVSEHDRPQVWAYTTTMKLADERYGSARE